MTTTAATQATQSRKGAVHMTALVTRTAPCKWCPAASAGELHVAIHDAHAVITPCANCIAKGFEPFRVRRTEADHYIPVVVAATWAHREGLVSFDV